MSAHPTTDDRSLKRRLSRAGLFLVVAGLQAALVLTLGHIRGREVPAVMAPRQTVVTLFDPPLRPEIKTDRSSGGAPASAARPQRPPTVMEQAEPSTPSVPTQTPFIDMARDSLPAPGPGNGDGDGAGSGDGAGDGTGSAGPQLVAGPTIQEIRANHPAGARSVYGRATLSCLIRLDSRLEGCRVVDESPPGRGFGAAALQVAAYFRFRPPVAAGRPVAGQAVTVGVEFGRPRGR